MQTLPTGWNEARNGLYRWETKLSIAGVEYTEANIFSLQTAISLYGDSAVSVGNCAANEINLTILPLGDIPRMAEIRVWVRPVADGIETGWLPKGVFYIDSRETDRVSGCMTIHGYDAMLKLEQVYIEDGEELTGWPKKMNVVANDIANLIGVEIDSRTVLSAAYTVEAPVSYTMREVMGWIAAAHGGNWTITDDGRLRLLTLASIPAETFYLVDENGRYITFGEDRIVVDSGEAPTWEIPADAAKVWVGNAASSLEFAPAFTPFTGVTAWYDDELAYQSGDDTGRRLELDCPWATQAMADNILAAINGYAYQPYSASGALLDPAAEIGDGVTVGGVYSIVAAVDVYFGAMMYADISAPSDEEVDHEYPYESRNSREMKRKVTLGKDYFGAKISKANGLEITKTDTDGIQKSRAVFNSDVFAMYDDDGSEALYFDSNAGKFKFRGTIEVTAGSMNINNNFIVDEEGNLTINGNINLSGGSITWGKNDPADGVGISASQARTIINDELVSSPNIAGGKFWDIELENWIEMGEAVNGSVAYFDHYYSGYSSSDPVFVMGYYNPTGRAPNWVMAPFNDIVLDYVQTNETMYVMGDWDFSQANVSGLSGVGGGDVTVTPVWG